MRRILMVLTVALIMVAMMAASAMPAFADNFGVQVKPHHNVTTNTTNNICGEGGFFPVNLCSFGGVVAEP